VDSLKVLDPERPIREADIGFPELLLRKIAVEPHFANRSFLFELRPI
jgi:hypothetical protein